MNETPDYVNKYGDSKLKLDRAIARRETAIEFSQSDWLFDLFFSFFRAGCQLKKRELKR